MPLKTAAQQVSRVSRTRLYVQPVEQLMDFIGIVEDRSTLEMKLAELAATRPTGADMKVIDNALDVMAPAALEHIDLVSDGALKQS